MLRVLIVRQAGDPEGRRSRYDEILTDDSCHKGVVILTNDRKNHSLLFCRPPAPQAADIISSLVILEPKSFRTDLNPFPIVF